MKAAEEFAGAGDAEAVGQQQRIVVVEVVERGVELAITFELRRVAFVDAGQIESAGFVEQPRLAGQPLGARGLRAIMEEIMTKIMYEIPSDPTIQSVCITERCVREGEPPQITRDAAKPRAPIKNAGVTL